MVKDFVGGWFWELILNEEALLCADKKESVNQRVYCEGFARWFSSCQRSLWSLSSINLLVEDCLILSFYLL
jgi:hypothetical protein